MLTQSVMSQWMESSENVDSQILEHRIYDNNQGIKVQIYSTGGPDNSSLFIGRTIGLPIIDIITKNPSFDSIYKLLIKAVNNRTIERDFFKLYCSFVDGAISEEEFESELEKNESKYVIQSNVIPSEFDLKIALDIAKDICDVKTVEDFSSLFSFNTYEIEHKFLSPSLGK